MSPNRGKWWRLKYRYGGKEKPLSLGVYPEVSMKDAHQRRDEARKLLANDVDPSEHRKAEKALSRENGASSFEVIAREWFDKHSANWVASHTDPIIRRLERDIFPWVGGTPIAAVTAPMLLDVVRRAGPALHSERRSALALSILRGETSAQEAARKHGLTAAELEDWQERSIQQSFRPLYSTRNRQHG